MKLLVTGGAGFIGSAFVRLAVKNRWATHLINFDKLTYAGNLENLTSIEKDPGYRFIHGDVCDLVLVRQVLKEERPDAIVHFAAESHVDRSILGPAAFVECARDFYHAGSGASREDAALPARFHRRSLRLDRGA
jgi:dTDP-glucose 4,6-dehydratase